MRKSWPINLTLFAIIALAGFLRLHQIGAKGLWLDEAFSVWMGRQSLIDLFSWLLKIDQHPPLYYTLLHFWLAFGDDAATVRTFSAILGILTIPIIYLIGMRLSGPRLGLVAAFILALAPFHIRFAQETRMYTLLTLNAALAMLSLVYLLTDPRAATEPIGRQFSRFFHTWRNRRAADEKAGSPPADFRTDLSWLTAPTQRRRLPLQTIKTDLAWSGYILFTVATVLSHNTAIFFPIALNIFTLALIAFKPSPHSPTPPHPFQPPTLQNWLIAQAAAFLLWSPWLAAFVLQSVGVYNEFWIPAPTWKRVLGTVANLLNPFLPDRLSWGERIWLGYGLAGLLGLWHFRRRPAVIALLLCLILIPFGGELLVSLRRPLFYDRTLIWTTIPLYLLLAAGLGQLRHRPYILVGVLMLATVNGLSLREYYLHFEKEQWDDAARYVAERVDSQDLLLFNATWVQIPFDFYFRRFNKGVAEHGAPVDLFERGILEPKMTPADVPRLRALLRRYDRIWLIYSHNWYTDPDGIVSQTLSAELTLFERRRFHGLEIHLYGTP